MLDHIGHLKVRECLVDVIARSDSDEAIQPVGNGLLDCFAFGSQ
jgi:hypothetical protein